MDAETERELAEARSALDRVDRLARERYQEYVLMRDGDPEFNEWLADRQRLIAETKAERIAVVAELMRVQEQVAKAHKDLDQIIGEIRAMGSFRVSYARARAVMMRALDENDAAMVAAAAAAQREIRSEAYPASSQTTSEH